jgi:Zn-dependent protease with chaperone function
VTATGTGVYFDGQTSLRQDVHVALGADLAIRGTDGRRIADWPFADLREVPGVPGQLRLTCEGSAPLARLDLRDPALAEDIRARSPNLNTAHVAEASVQRRVVLWSLAAVVSAALFGVYGVPALADQIAPLLPWSVDQRMGAAVDRQIRYVLPIGGDRFECGDRPEEKPGRAALDALAKRLSDAAGLPIPIRIVAVDSDIPNALALPGSPVYLFNGLIQAAQSPDEVAGVIAHEIGHVAHRDGSRRTLQAGGTSFLFGFVLGDFAGGTVAIFIARTLSEASYSRAVESAADAYAVALMRKVGGDPKALGGFLARLDAEDDDKGSPLDYLASHPATAERKRAIDVAAGDAGDASSTMMDEASFRALKSICGGSRP